MGLSNKLLITTYRNIALKLLFNAFAIGLPVSLLLGISINGILEIGFNLWHWTILMSIILIVLILSGLVFFILNNTLSATPGDLIYERKN